MALIFCPQCGRQVSDKAPACPGCGYDISRLVNLNAQEEETHRHLMRRKIHPNRRKSESPSALLL